MKLSIKSENPNYLCRFTILREFRPIEGAANIKQAIVEGSSIVVAIDTPEGARGVFFPVESTVNKQLLFENNLFDDPNLNKDQTKKSYFGKHGRVRAISLMKVRSEGYFISTKSFNFLVDEREWDKVKDGTYFDCINETIISEKYTVQKQIQGAPGVKGKKVRQKNRLVPGQFNFHYQTPHLSRNLHMINFDDMITVTSKLHGTSAVFARVLMKRNLSVWEKAKKFFGVKVKLVEYSDIFSSRSVIKTNNDQPGFYPENVWEIEYRKMRHLLEDKMTIYSELVGFLPSGKHIQKNYCYGCEPGQSKSFIYRITTTAEDGTVEEWPMSKVIEFCKVNGENHVPLIYSGLAGNMFPELERNNHWHEEWLAKLQSMPPMEQKCPMCKSAVFEGICVRSDNNKVTLKLKTHKFSVQESRQLDAQECDIESEES